MPLQHMTPTAMSQKLLIKFLDEVVTWATEVDGDLDNINDNLHFINERDGVFGGNHTMGVGTTDTTMVRMSGTCHYRIGGVDYYASNVEGDLATGEVTQAKFGAWRLLLGKTGAITTQRATANGTSGTMAYNSIEDALLSLSQIAITANTVEIGYLVIEAAAGGFTPGTDNPETASAAVTAATYYNVLVPRLDNGLTAAQSVTMSEGTTNTQYAFGTIDAKVNGVNLAQIAADTTQAFADADTVTDATYSGHLFVTDLAGTNVFSLAATGIAGSAQAMSYATEALATTALNAAQAALPVLFTVVGRMTMLANKAFTFGTDDVAGTDGTATWTNETTAEFDRTVTSGAGVGTTSPTVPATVTAPIPSRANL